MMQICYRYVLILVDCLRCCKQSRSD